MVEDNAILGNTNGVVLSANATGNVVRRNILAGNPVVQTSVDHASNDGVDIKNFSPAGANTIENNFCLTALNAQCPSIPRVHPEKAVDGQGQPR